MTSTAEPMTLEQTPESLRALAEIIRKHGTCAPMALEEIADAIDAELAKQREAEPVAQVRVTNAGVIWRHDNAAAKSLGIGDHSLYTNPQQREAKPVATKDDPKIIGYISVLGALALDIEGTPAPMSFYQDKFFCIPVFDNTHPQQRNAVKVRDERKSFERWYVSSGIQNDDTSAKCAAWFAWYRRAIAQPVSVPEGWQLVPSIPSSAMIKAGDEDGDWGYYESSLTCRPPEDGNSVDIYFAMLSAAPKREGE